MSLRSGVVPLDELRGVVSSRLSTMSLRGVARAVGMSPTGLQKFVDGSVPYPPTRQKLERWYVRETARYGGEVSVGLALDALDVLLQDIPADQRRRTACALVARLSEACRDGGSPRPEWLDVLVREMEI